MAATGKPQGQAKQYLRGARHASVLLTKAPARRSSSKGWRLLQTDGQCQVGGPNYEPGGGRRWGGSRVA